MGKLTEKELEIEVGQLKASFLALYNNGQLETVLLYLEANDNKITFDHSAEFGGHRLIQVGRKTPMIKTLESFLLPEMMELIHNQLIIFKNAETKN